MICITPDITLDGTTSPNSWKETADHNEWAKETPYAEKDKCPCCTLPSHYDEDPSCVAGCVHCLECLCEHMTMSPGNLPWTIMVKMESIDGEEGSSSASSDTMVNHTVECTCWEPLVNALYEPKIFPILTSGPVETTLSGTH